MRARALGLALMACAAPVLAEEGDPARGAVLFERHCAVCHGLSLEGDGPMAEVLTVPPPDLARIAERYGSFPRVGMAWKIDGRDPLVSHGGEMLVFGRVFGEMSAIMRDGSQTILTAPEVVHLVAYLEQVQE
ncbi:MAG: c-type cytochrome [Roseicyclus sp.]